MLSTWPSAFSFPWVLTPYLTDDAHRLVLCSRLSHYLLNVPYYKDLYYGAQPPPRINHHSVSLSIFFVTSLSPDVMVHVAQRRHELKGLGELHDLRRTDMYHLDQQWWHSATETALHEKKRLHGYNFKDVSRVSRCLRGEARSSVHTAAGWALAAWSSWQSSPGRSAPRTGRWPPPAEPVATTEDTNDLCSLDSVDSVVEGCSRRSFIHQICAMFIKTTSCYRYKAMLVHL